LNKLQLAGPCLQVLVLNLLLLLLQLLLLLCF
jgi:hypothetical protein